MSYGSPGRRSSSGKGFAAKKDKRKRQGFHEHRQRRPEETILDLAHLKERTITALERLGHQRLSAEVGGYSLESWVRNLTALLDDFEEAVAPRDLPAVYAEKRRELASLQASNLPSTSLDEETSRLRRELADANKRMADERDQVNSKIGALCKEQTDVAEELQRQKRRLAELKAETQSRPFFKRVLGRDKPQPIEPVESRIAELDARLASLPGEIAKLQTASRTIAKRQSSPDDPYGEMWRDLDSLHSKLNDLENARIERLQLSQEREQLAAAFAEIVSKVTSANSGEEGGPSSG